MIEILPVIMGVALAQIAPGPNMVAVSSLALSVDRRAGLMCAAGVTTSIFFWAMLFALGVGTIVSTYPALLLAMKFVGGGYLLFLAGKSVGVVRQGKQPTTAISDKKRSHKNAYFTGVLVNLTNPKTAMMWAAISMFLASVNPAPGKFLLVGVCAAVSAMLIYGTYAFLFSTGLAIRAYDRFFRIIDLSFGLVFGALGARLVLDGLRDARS